MAAKVQEVEQKKGSKAWNREGEKGQWWPSEVTESELKAFEKEGIIAPDTWSFNKDSSTPTQNLTNVSLPKLGWSAAFLFIPPSSSCRCLALTASSHTISVQIPFSSSPTSQLFARVISESDRTSASGNFSIESRRRPRTRLW